MSQTAGSPMPEAGAEQRVGVIEALGLGWRLMMSDFWSFWLVALVAWLLVWASGMVPFGQFVVGPPIGAGFFYVLMRRIDGSSAGVGEIFEGFKQRFGESILSLLPILIAWAAWTILYLVSYFVLIVSMGVMGGSEEQPDPEKFFAVFLPFLAMFCAMALAVSVFQIFFMFSLVAVWEHPKAGWAAAKQSMRLVRDHFWSALGLFLLSCLIVLGAEIAGLLACCLGIFVTIPAVMVWMGATIIYLYRSWMGRPLVEFAALEPLAPPPQGT